MARNAEHCFYPLSQEQLSKTSIQISTLTFTVCSQPQKNVVEGKLYITSCGVRFIKQKKRLIFSALQ